jgi:hypothetical protein
MQDIRINNWKALEEAALLEGCSCEVLLNRIIDQHLEARKGAAMEAAMKERRAFARKNVLIPANVFIVLKDREESIQLEGVISNISLTGARIQLHDDETLKRLLENSEDIPVGVDFKINRRREKLQFRGETRHFSNKRGTVEIGIAFRKSNSESLDALYRYIHSDLKEDEDQGHLNGQS